MSSVSAANQIKSRAPAATTSIAVRQTRLKIFEQITEILVDLSKSDRRESEWGSARAWVWAFGTSIGRPTTSVGPDGSHLRVFWPIGLSASISIRLTDCRIGFLVPQRTVSDVTLLANFNPYPDNPQAPSRLFRQIGGTDALLDFVFTERLGDFGLLRGAFSGDHGDISVLADGIGAEVGHIAAAMTHHLAEAGVYLGIDDQGDMLPLHVTTANPNVAKVLGVPPGNVILAGSGDVPGTTKYLVLVPRGENITMSQRINALQHGEFLLRQAVPETFELDGLMLRASAGVYHPGIGSSTRFAIDALRRVLIKRPGPVRALDLGCGTGAIALWLKQQHPTWQVYGTDIDERAVQDARDNASINGISASFAVADLLEDLPHDTWDLIVWNYPFWQVKLDGGPEVDYEQIGIDENGELLSRFVAQLPEHLNRDGSAYLTYSTMSSAALLHELCDRHDLVAHRVVQDGDDGGYSRQLWQIYPAGDL